jgi:hypothetical protein
VKINVKTRSTNETSLTFNIKYKPQDLKESSLPKRDHVFSFGKEQNERQTEVQKEKTTEIKKGETSK